MNRAADDNQITQFAVVGLGKELKLKSPLFLTWYSMPTGVLFSVS